MRSFVALLFLCGLTVACAGIGVETNFEPGTDFSSLKTWSFAPETAHLGEGTDERVRGAVRNAMEAKRLREEPEGADFWVSYDAILDSGGVSQGTNTSSRPSWASGGGNRANLSPRQGDLAILIIEPASKNVIWSGHATASVAGDASPVERAAQLQQAVQLVLAEFPPN